jgi:hypothetical protein
VAFSRGDKVVAREDISVGFLHSIKRGSKGVVTEPEGFISGPKVIFEGHEGEHEVSSRKLMKY